MKRPNRAFLVLAGIAAFAWVLVVGAYIYHFHALPIGDPEKWGPFGDYVAGMLNPVLGTLTVGGIIYTIGQQREVLRLAQLQLDQSTQIAGSQRIVDQQHGFEQMFFELQTALNARVSEISIRIHRDELRAPVVDTALDPPAPIPPNGGTFFEATGAEAFALFIRLFGATYLHPASRGDHLSDSEQNEALREGTAKLLLQYDYALGPVMRGLSDLLLYIDEYQSRLVTQQLAQDSTQLGINYRDSSFFGRIAINARTRYEVKVYAMYVGCGLAGSESSEAAKKYKAFAAIESDWWGRQLYQLD